MTPEQQNLICLFREKWSRIVSTSEPVQQQAIIEAVEAAYKIIDKQKPTFIFCESPNSALEAFKKLENQCIIPLMKFAWDLREQIPSMKELGLANKREKYRYRPLWSQIQFELENQLGIQIKSAVHPLRWLAYTSWFDFCISTFNLPHDQEDWKILQIIVKNCNLLFPTERFCIVSDRPTRLSLDEKKQLHAEGDPAVVYSDGFSLYFYHGIAIPKRYGKLNPSDWEIQWLFEEEDFEIKQALAQGLGYRNLIQNLHSIEIASKAEYTLLRLEGNATESIVLMEISSPSSYLPKLVVLPSTIQSIPEAISWITLELNRQRIQLVPPF
jgi:hypothetical protein